MKLPKFHKKNQALQIQVIEILKREKPMTLRSLYYRLASAGHIEATDKGYDQLKRITRVLRECGEIPLTGTIVDRVRTTLKPSSWSGLADFGDTVRQVYRKDMWPQMPHHIEIFVEKDAIAGTIQPVTREYDVALNVIRGDVSISFAGEIANQWKRIRKPIYAYYLGDYDPSGFGIEDELRSKLCRYSGRTPNWQRIGVVESDFAAFNLLPLPVKQSARSHSFIAEHGQFCAEVDALPPSELRSRVERAIENHIDQRLWRNLQHIEQLEQQTLINLVSDWQKSDLGSISSAAEEGGAE